MIHTSAGMRAPRSAPTAMPERPSEFITTTLHDPPVGSQTTVWGPEPVAEAAQKSCVPGGDAGVPPSTVSVLSSQNSVITVRFTPAR